MKPAPFEYYAPDSLEAALAIKAEHGDDAKALAGGQSLIPAMNFRVAQPTMLVDLNGVSELSYIREEKGELHIGAMTRKSEAEHSPTVKKHSPLLHEAIPFIAHPQIRNRGTMGGSLVHADPAAELPVVSLALDAQFRVQSKKGERTIKAKDFFEGLFTVSLAPEELLIEVIYPKFPKRTGWSFMEISRRKGDYAMAGVAALISLDKSGTCEGARLVYLNVGDGPMDAREATQLLVGEKMTEETIEAATSLATEKEISPFGNVHTSAEFQRHLSAVLTRRALEAAINRAQSNGK